MLKHDGVIFFIVRPSKGRSLKAKVTQARLINEKVKSMGVSRVSSKYMKMVEEIIEISHG